MPPMGEYFYFDNTVGGRMNQNSDEHDIHEGRGKFPWWIWMAVAIWVIYAFFIAPFDLTSPLK